MFFPTPSFAPHKSAVRPKRRNLTAALTLTALTAFSVPAALPARASGSSSDAAAKRRAQRVELRGKLSSVQEKKKAVREKLKQAKRSEGAIAGDLHTIQDRLHGTRVRLARSKSHLEEAQAQQRKANKALNESRARLQAREMALARRMAANYRQGPVRYASVLLGSRSMGEMVSRAHVVREIVAYDAKLIAEIKQNRTEVMNWKREADARAAEIAQVTQELGAQEDAISQDTIRQRQVLAEARDRSAEIAHELDELEEDSASIAARIRQLEETPVGRTRTMRPFAGRFMRPVNASVISNFGMRYHPILHRTRLHAGVDMPASTGTPIAAAASGVVVFSGRMNGYGNVVVIDHGGGMSTLYAHCSARLVSEGQSVSQGQTIARVGATGLATGPHLHFEIRRNGTPINPASFL